MVWMRLERKVCLCGRSHHCPDWRSVRIIPICSKPSYDSKVWWFKNLRAIRNYMFNSEIDRSYKTDSLSKYYSPVYRSLAVQVLLQCKLHHSYVFFVLHPIGAFIALPSSSTPIGISNFLRHFHRKKHSANQPPIADYFETLTRPRLSFFPKSPAIYTGYIRVSNEYVRQYW